MQGQRLRRLVEEREAQFRSAPEPEHAAGLCSLEGPEFERRRRLRLQSSHPPAARARSGGRAPSRGLPGPTAGALRPAEASVRARPATTARRVGREGQGRIVSVGEDKGVCENAERPSLLPVRGVKAHELFCCAPWIPCYRAPSRRRGASHHLPSGRGGIGRRTGFRFQRRKSWGFESLRPHQSRQDWYPDGSARSGWWRHVALVRDWDGERTIFSSDEGELNHAGDGNPVPGLEA